MKTFSRRILALLLACMLCAAPALAAPSIYASALTDTPQMQYLKAEELASWLVQYHLDSGLNDDPLLFMYRRIFDTDATPSAAVLRRDLIAYFEESPDHFMQFASAMFHAYDAHSYFMTQTEHALLYSADQSYTGMGITVQPHGPVLRIAQVYADSPADKVGVRAGDLLCAVDGQDIRGLPYEEAVALLPGAKHTLSFLRDGTVEDIHIEIGDIRVPNITWSVTDDGIGVLHILRFGGSDYLELLEEACAVFTDAGIGELIIDLRDNPGGGIDLAVATLNAVVSEPDILLLTEFDRYQRIPHYSEGTGLPLSSLVVLVNGNSASSAELFSGALRDAGLATLVGEATYGKGRGQMYIPYLDDTVMVMTVSEIELPVTGLYDGQGLVPDREIENTRVPVLDAVLSPLPTDRNLASTADTAQIKALEQRLAVLGYGVAQPDGVYDEDTRTALHAFQKGQSLPVLDYLTPKAAVHLNQLATALVQATVAQDDQMDTALALVRGQRG